MEKSGSGINILDHISIFLFDPGSGASLTRDPGKNIQDAQH
jgi:hypothetical protein